jgi:glycosyltransferase involved in cell wall biosynthesis
LPNWTITSSFCIESKINSFISRPSLVYIGRFTSSKGIFEVVDLLKKFDSNNIEIDMLFLGDGDLNSYLESLKFKSINIKIESFNSKSELKHLLEKVNYCLLPSKNEGLPNVLFESMEFGVIPFFSDVGCINEYLIHGINGFLWHSTDSVFDTIKFLHGNKTSSLIVLNNMHKFVTDNTNKKIISKLLDFNLSDTVNNSFK